MTPSESILTDMAGAIQATSVLSPVHGALVSGFSPCIAVSRTYYCELFLHLTWHTKLSRPLLAADVEQLAQSCLREKAASLGVRVYEVGGIETHVHLAVSIEPTTLISDLVGQLKGYSSHEVNRRLGQRSKVLEWQTGYGVVSFGAKDLPWVVAYIQNQREHHGRGAMQDRLERITVEED